MHICLLRCQGSPYSFLVQENEFKDLEKPDGLRFIRGAQFDRFGNGLITSRSSVLLLYKGAWKEKGTLLECLQVARLRFARPERSVGNQGPSCYEFASYNMDLGPSGWCSKGGLAIFDCSEPSEH
jgi:hypothetical protein